MEKTSGNIALLVKTFKDIYIVKTARNGQVALDLLLWGPLKGKCAIKIFDKHLELKKRYWGRHFWAKGCCVNTVGLDEEKVRQ